jgi:hypothetical protein
MEYVMDTSLRRKVQTYSHVVDQLGDAVGPDVARLQLALVACGREDMVRCRRRRPPDKILVDDAGRSGASEQSAPVPDDSGRRRERRRVPPCHEPWQQPESLPARRNGWWVGRGRTPRGTESPRARTGRPCYTRTPLREATATTAGVGLP